MIYKKLREMREDFDMTQIKLSKHLNITQRAYSSYETGFRSIPVEVLAKLAALYDTSVDYLIGRTEEKRPYPKTK